MEKKKASNSSATLGTFIRHTAGSTLTPDLVACSAALATVAKAATPAWQTSVQLLREMQEMRRLRGSGLRALRGEGELWRFFCSATPLHRMKMKTGKPL